MVEIVSSVLLQNQCLNIGKTKHKGFIAREPMFWDRINESNVSPESSLIVRVPILQIIVLDLTSLFMYVDKIEIVKCEKGEK